MYIALTGCAQQGASGAPLAGQIDISSLIDTVDVADVATGSVVTFTTLVGELDFTVIPSGGTGAYQFTWSVTKVFENSDTGSRFSVASTGTTNTVNYNSLTINGARGANGGDVWDAEFTVECDIDDGIDIVTVQSAARVNGISF